MPSVVMKPILTRYFVQFFLRESDIGKNRAEASLPRLVELNEYVSTNCTTELVSNDLVKVRIRQCCYSTHNNKWHF